MDGHAHSAATTATGRHRTRLAIACGLTGAFVVVEVVAGLWSGSLALLADAGHMLTDFGGLALALLAIWWAAKSPSPTKTYGYYRVEILAAVANAVVLLVMSFFILWEAYRRLVHPPEVIGLPMLIVGVVGLLVNLASLALLRAGASESLNVKGAYLEVMSDALGSAGVLVAAGLVTWGWRRADPIIGGAIGLFIIPRTWALLRQGINVLLEGVPPHLDIAEIERAIRSISGVESVHDLHVWTLTSGRDAMSGHLAVRAGVDTDQIMRDVHETLHQRFGIEHTTLQIEPPRLISLKGGKGR